MGLFFMSLILQAKTDIEQITSDPQGFGWPLKFTARVGGEVAEVRGLYTKHHMGFNTEGLMTNIKNAHCSCSEKFLTDLGYPTRNAAGELSMKGDKVEVVDVNGQAWTYIINEQYPDETVGLNVFMLGDYE